MAYALLRLAALTGSPDFGRAAVAAIHYEDRVFEPDEGNWPDLRKEALAANGGRPSFLTQWCHGATGIGLARLAGLDALDTPTVRADIEAAVEATRRFGAQNVDHACCGSMGRAELLLSAGRRLHRPELVDEAGRFAATVVGRATARDGYRVVGRLPRGVGCPSFFQGTAGIGYHLLRLAEPDLVPSVLVWE
jgi:lantibiotic modifying enzyme